MADGVQNFSNPDLSAVFACVAQIGSLGCSFRQPFASIVRALGADGAPAPAHNAGFLRPDASLAVIVVSNKDDCSVPSDSHLFDLGTKDLADPQGPLGDFRCDEFGDLRHATRAPTRIHPTMPDVVGATYTLDNCHSNETGPTHKLTPVADFVAQINSLKTAPATQIPVAALSGSANPLGLFPRHRGRARVRPYGAPAPFARRQAPARLTAATTLLHATVLPSPCGPAPRSHRRIFRRLNSEQCQRMLGAMTDTNSGRFVWYELLTTDPKGAIAFYPEVVGWKTQPFETGNDYTMWVGGQGPLGGVTLMPDAAKKMGAPPYWQANIQVANVDQTVAKVKQLGGQVYVVEEVPTVGRFAVIADPQGAVIAVFTPARDVPSHDTAKPGEFSWHELYTTDHEAAFRFYSQLAGWQRLGEFDMGPMGKYLLWGRDGKQLGGMMTKPKDLKTPDGRDVPPLWMFYITTDDLDAALARAKAAGARVINGPMDVPGGQRIVQLMDPQGAAFSLVTAPKP